MIISGRVLLSAFTCWIIIFFCVFRSLRSVGAVVKVTFPLPFAILVGLTVRGVFLDGAVDGFKNYLIQWNTTVLTESTDVWSDATGNRVGARFILTVKKIIIKDYSW